MSPDWRLANSYGILPAAVHTGSHLLLNNSNIADLEISGYHLSTLYFLDSWGSQQSKERIITGAGLAQPRKSYHAVRTGEFNRQTSKNPYVIASIEAPSKSAGWRSKFVISHTCATLFWNFLIALCRFGVLVTFPPCLIGWYPDTYWWNYSKARIWVLKYNNHTADCVCTQLKSCIALCTHSCVYSCMAVY
jgi:hypothetical protein